MQFVTYIAENGIAILLRTLEHIQLTFLSILIAVIIGVPLGILISYVAGLRKPVLGCANVVQAVPSIALLGFLVPVLGIGEKPAVCMVVVYSLLPIIKNTATGLANINPQTIEAAKGIGMTRFQILTRVKLPLALPVIMAGIRISAVTSVGLVTLAAFIGAAGLGYLIYSGIRTVNTYQILSGAMPACLLALTVDFVASLVEKAVTPACYKE
ncbi:MAG: ABC transporter permease [Treponema sp.]|nr:ABC transporter permease [Treponema sp.]